MLFGRHDDQDRKARRLAALEDEATAAVRQAKRALEERDRVATAVHNTVQAVRRPQQRGAHR